MAYRDNRYQDQNGRRTHRNGNGIPTAHNSPPPLPVTRPGGNPSRGAGDAAHQSSQSISSPVTLRPPPPPPAQAAFEGMTAIGPGMQVQPGMLYSHRSNNGSNASDLNMSANAYRQPPQQPLITTPHSAGPQHQAWSRPMAQNQPSYQSVQADYDDDAKYVDGHGEEGFIDDQPLLSPLGRTNRHVIEPSNGGMLREDSYGMPPSVYNDLQAPAYPPSNGAYADPGTQGVPGAWMNPGINDYRTASYDNYSPNPYYGRIPARVPRRYKTTKRIELFRGNLVLDCPAPTKLLALLPEALRKERESQVMRYTAATCDPDNWANERYTLRQEMYEPKRRTELFICATMYNEDDQLFTRTMHGVFKNISHFCSRERSKIWGRDGWKKIVVCIVSDGREKINARTLSCLAAMGAYQDGVAKNVVNGKPVTAHVYEYTTQISIDPDLKFKGNERGIVPVQIIFCLKEKNKKKINSHRWFFNAFSHALQPNICILLDVGTMPGPRSLYHLWKTFDVNSSIGGACGEIVALKGKYGRNLFNPLVAAQNFEYKMSNILDKTTESVLGYITVLPGAFSAYRFIALQNDTKNKGPLASYFLGEKMHGEGAGVFEANMYLAEDRILCFEIVTKKGCSWLLHYVKSAYAVTDVPDAVPEWVSQRRRWLNGSFFAAIHAVAHFGRFWTSGHNVIRKIYLTIEMIYQLINLIFSWFSLGNFYIFFTIITSSLADPSFDLKGMDIVYTVLHWVYLALLVVIFVLSLGNRPQGSKISYTFAMFAFAMFMLWMSFATIFITYKGVINIKDSIEASGASFTVKDLFGNSIFVNIAVSLLSTFGLYIAASLVALDPWHMLTSFIQYYLLAPSFVNILQPYAFCNTHDVTWGTKGDNSIKTDLGVVQGGKDSKHVDIILPTEEKDINAAYDDACHVLTTKAVTIKTKRDPTTKQEDYYKSVRTRVVLFYCLSNGALVAAILSTGLGYNSVNTNGREARSSAYLAILLWTVAVLAAFRFVVGSIIYTFLRLFNRS